MGSGDSRDGGMSNFSEMELIKFSSGSYRENNTSWSREFKNLSLILYVEDFKISLS